MARTTLTYADYAALPDDGRRYELHEGELSVTPAPGVRHQRVLLNLADTLLHHVKAGRLGEVFLAPLDCIMTDITVVQPDIVYVSRDRSALISERAIEGAPTLAIEIVSPSSERIDRQRKFDLYARHGVPHYWIVDPATREILAYVLTAGVYRLVARLAGEQPQALPPFDGLELDPAAIWA
jgi:Uma2 family endonuclease